MRNLRKIENRILNQRNRFLPEIFENKSDII